MTILKAERDQGEDRDSRRSLAFIRWSLPYLDIGCAMAAAAAWYVAPGLGPQPMAIALLPWVLRVLVGWPVTMMTRFALPFTFFLATAAVGVWAAYDREPAWAKFWVIVGGVFLFYAFANGYMMTKEAAEMGRRHGWLLALLGGVVALYFVATNDWAQPGKMAAVTSLGRAITSVLPAVPGHRLHPNVAGGILAMLVPFSAATFVGENRRAAGRGRVVFLGGALVLTGLILFGLFMSASRGAWLAVVGAAVVAACWQAAGWFTSRQPGWRPYLFAVVLILVAAPPLVIFSGNVMEGDSLSPLTTTAGPSPQAVADSLNRLDLMRDSLILVFDYPFLGAGLDNFGLLHSSYAYFMHVAFIVHSHNLFLNMVIEQGVIALAALFWLWIIVGVAFLRLENAEDKLVRQAEQVPTQGDREPVMFDPQLVTLLGAAVLSLVIVAVHGLFDDALYGSRAVLLMFVPLAFAVPVFLNKGERLALKGKPLMLLIGLAVLAFLGWQRPVRSLLYSNLAAVEQSRLELSAYQWPEVVIQDEVRRQLDLGPVVAGYEQALALNPGNATANRRLGQIELSLGEYEAALVYLEAAYEATPWDNATRQLWGEALIVNGRVEEGAAIWAMVDRSNDQLELRAFWYDHIGDNQRLAWIRAAIGESDIQ
jgi:hypothetical protein